MTESRKKHIIALIRNSRREESLAGGPSGIGEGKAGVLKKVRRRGKVISFDADTKNKRTREEKQLVFFSGRRG